MASDSAVVPPSGSASPHANREGWRYARHVLRGPLRTLVAGQSFGQGADGFAQIAFAQLVLFEPGKGAAPARIAALLAATLLPFSLVGPFAGALIDRWDRRRVLVIVSMARVVIAVGAIAVAIARSDTLAYVGIVCLLSSSRFVLAAKGAALPRTVAPDELVTANAVSSVAGMVAAFGGAVIGSTFVGVAPAAGFVVAAVGYALAALAFGRLPPVGGGDQVVALGTGVVRAWRELIEGTRAIVRTPAVRDPLVTVWLHRFLLGAGFILGVLVADRRYHLHASGYGLILAVTGAGAFAGTLAAPVLARRYRPVALLPLTFVWAALPVLLGGYAPELAILIAAVGVVAVAFQVLKVLVDALVGGASEDHVRGRVFAAYDVIYNVAFVVAGLALIPLWQLGRERALLWGIAAAFALSGLAVARRMRVWPCETKGRERKRPVHAWRLRIAAFVVGALPALAFPAPSWWWLAWVSLVPLLLLVRSAPSAREAGLRSWWGATGFMVAMQYWLAPNIGPFLLIFGAAIGALWLPWGRLAWELLARPSVDGRRLAAALVLLPSGWVVIEAIRSWQSLGGPWGMLGASQWNMRPTLALASLGGVWLVSFTIVAANVAVVGVLSHVTRARVKIFALVAVAGAWGAGPCWYLARPAAPAGRVVGVAIVQPGVTKNATARFDAGEAISETLTRQVAGHRVDLVVWGESSFGYDLDHRPDLLARLENITRRAGADLLINIDTRRAGEGGIYKTSVLVTPHGVTGRYDKMRLVPFGEYIPFRFALGWISRFSSAAKEDRRRGGHLTMLHTDGFALGPLVCFESSFTDMSRNLANRGVAMIVVQSATSTFQGSWAPAQHAGLAAVRAVETGRPIVHATLTGESAAFDGRGRRLGHLSTRRRGALVVRVPLSRESTPYDRLGDWVPALSFIALAMGATGRALRHARRAE